MQTIQTTGPFYPKKLSCQATEALTDELYSVQQQVFTGVSREAFQKYAICPDSYLTKVYVLRDTDKNAVGYFTFHVYEVEIERAGKRKNVYVFRGETAVIKAHRRRAPLLRADHARDAEVSPAPRLARGLPPRHAGSAHAILHSVGWHSRTVPPTRRGNAAALASDDRGTRPRPWPAAAGRRSQVCARSRMGSCRKRKASTAPCNGRRPRTSGSSCSKIRITAKGMGCW